MKKNITINLCGRLYQIDEDAYELLSQYIDALRNYFMKQEGGEEIANDIEERVAELFDDLKAEGSEAITIEHVQGVIQQIGQLEDIVGEEASTAVATQQGEAGQAGGAGQEKKAQGGKKFYRDSHNKMVAGVLSGCAQYFGSSVSMWRWGYTIICLVWWLLTGVGMLLFTLPFDTLFGFLVLPFTFIPLLCGLLPLLPYFLVAIFSSEAKTPEDVLKMKGKEVNPQNLAEEVQESNLRKGKQREVTLWDVFVGLISIGWSVLLAIGFIVALCFFAAFIGAHELMADKWWNIDKMEDVQAVTIPAIISGIMMLVSIAILLYCSIHAAISSFGKAAPMSAKQRLLWFFLWVASVVGFVGCTTWAVGRVAKTQMARWDKEAALRVEESVTDELGHVFSREEWDFFEQNGWELITAENTDRYTYSGEWMTGDRKVRYLDACNYDAPVIYTARKKREVESGIYRLSAAVRADGTGRFIYLNGQTIDPVTNDTTQLPTLVKAIPVCGSDGGNIVEYAQNGSTLQGSTVGTNGEAFTYEEVVNELVNHFSPRDRQNISRANFKKGYGWSYIYIDSIRVEKPSELFYGVTTDERITGSTATTGWFSATDFKLERIGDL